MVNPEEYFEANYCELHKLGLYVSGKIGILKENALDGIQEAMTHTYLKMKIANKRETEINEAWIRTVFINKILSQSRRYFRWKSIFLSADEWLLQNIDSVEQNEIDISANNKIKTEVLSFIDKHYTNPKIRAKYQQYFEIFCEKVIDGLTWKEMQQKYPSIDMKTVNSRIHNDILKLYKFRKEHDIL